MIESVLLIISVTAVITGAVLLIQTMGEDQE